MSAKPSRGASLPRLAAVMARLLGPGGCPWDRTQSLASLKRFAVEEAHEVCDAVDALGPDASRTVTTEGAPMLGADAPAVAHHRDELGDLLLQVVFQSGLAEGFGWFTLDDVVAAICDKLECRHPHVFGDAEAADAEAVITRWEAIKRAEKGDKPGGALDGVPRSMPALLRAMRVGEKAGRMGFDWPDATGPRARIVEELAEMDAAVAAGDLDAAADELGDVLFSAVNLARKLGADPEAALHRTTARFVTRFARVEALAAAAGRTVDTTEPTQLEAWWQQAKADVG